MTRYAELMRRTGKTFAVENCHWGKCGQDAWYHNPDGSSCPGRATAMALTPGMRLSTLMEAGEWRSAPCWQADESAAPCSQLPL